jgi:hypothetical protein
MASGWPGGKARRQGRAVVSFGQRCLDLPLSVLVDEKKARDGKWKVRA